MTTRVRCAIYTRKSSEEGLEQDFNSLHAQREACAAYVMSQASEGWSLLPAVYDDGGISGGTLERPALQRLLADITAGGIDIVVVYKVDRLTRSLLDFARLVETFDKAGVSFVSITQSFNTTTSMGRLTLNMLLSFAQFEREVTAERIRDKIAASKAKGMWMGGTPPLGYRPDGRSLAIVEAHAALIRDVYRRYLALGNVRLVAEQLTEENIRTPLRSRVNGAALGGRLFTRGQLYALLRNPIYAGDIAHRGKRFTGLHTAIIDRETWDAVQTRLADNSQGEKRTRSPHRSLLAGRLVDAAGDPMLAAHASKGAVRYRYYISRSLQTDPGSTGMRLPAREIEGVVKEHVAQLFDDPLVLASQLALKVTPVLLRQLSETCADTAGALRHRTGGPLRAVVSKVRAFEQSLEVSIDVRGIIALLGAEVSDDPPPLTLSIPYRLTRTGQALRLIQADGTFLGRETNAALVAMLVQAHNWWKMLTQGDIDVRTLAKREGVNEGYLTRTLRAAFLSPQVTAAILAGRQSAAVTAAPLRQPGAIPASWQAQAATFLPA